MSCGPINRKVSAHFSSLLYADGWLEDSAEDDDGDGGLEAQQ